MNGERPFTLSEYQSDIDAVGANLASVEHSNANLVRSYYEADDEYSDTIRDGIEDEQIDDMEEVFAAAANIPYEEIGNVYLARAKALAEAEAMITEDEERLTAGLGLAKQLTTRRHDELEEIYEKQIQEIRARTHHVEELRRQMSEIEELYDATSPAWPIPQALDPKDIMALYEATGSNDDWEIVDIIPVTPEERIETIGLADKAKRVIENRQLSDFIMFYLRERKDVTVTVEDMIRFCYAADVESDRGGDLNYRSRITSALGPHSHGLKKQEELNDEGLLLQYGWRYAFERTSDDRLVTRRRTRIYRVVDEHQDTSEEPRGEIGSFDVTDKWRTTADQILRPTGDFEDDTAESEPIALTPVDGRPILESVPVLHPDPERANSWEEVFIEKVNEAVTWGIETGLLRPEDDEVPVHLVRDLSDSDTMGTLTSRQKLVRAGHMKRGQLRDAKMTYEQVIISRLLNTSPELAGSRSRKITKRAAEIVGAVIARHMNELAQATK